MVQRYYHRPLEARYQFTHALIQETLTEELTLTRRVRLHARIAETLEVLYADNVEAHAAELAHHFAEAEAMLGGQSSEGWLFTTLQGEIIRSNNFRDRIWKPLLKATGVPYRWVHATRHTYATRMIMSGGLCWT